jgi:DNA-binding MarR family transcriptional regulator
MKKDNQTKVLIEFFKSPEEGMQLREIGRKIGLAPMSVKKYLEELQKEGIITKKKNPDNDWTVYTANTDNKQYHYLKSLHHLHTIREEGLIEHIEKECKPEVIIISGIKFDEKTQKLRIFLGSERKKLTLEGYEKVLGTKIEVTFLKEEALNSQMEEEMINGIVIKGTLRFLESEEEAPRPTETEEYLDLTNNGNESEGFYSRAFKE